MNYKAALKGLTVEGTLEWVVENVSVRVLDVAEQRAKRIEQARLREPLPYAELPGISFQPPISGKEAHYASGELVYEAHRFVSEAA